MNDVTIDELREYIDELNNKIKNFREQVRDYLNVEIDKDKLMWWFDIEECKCGRYELEEDMGHYNYDLGCYDEKICKSCKESE